MHKVRLLAGSESLLHMARRCFMRRSNTTLSSHNFQSSSGSEFLTREAIAPEMVTIEILPAVEKQCSHHPSDGSSSGGDNNSKSNGSTEYMHSGDGMNAAGCGRDALRQKHYWDVTSIDNFSKSRVLNYVRRTGNQSADVFEVSTETMHGRTVYRARCKLLLPPPHHLYVAEGIGEDEKDAELLAAMHAERVCDALGVPLFRLPSMQQKYAENARRQGRYAPMPGDPIKPENTITPPPLRMLASSSSSSLSSSAPDGGTAVNAGDGGSSSVFSTTITEAEIIDDRSTTRKGKGKCTSRLQSSQVASFPSSVKSPLDTPATTAATTTTTRDSGSVEGGDVVDSSGNPPYHTTVHYPWISFTSLSSNGAVGNAAAPAGAAAASSAGGVSGVGSFDPTEGGMWQMVNVNSTRCSPSPDALLLPCVYETAAYERLKDHFLQHGMSLKERLTIAHVAVPGHSTRMYVAELRLYDAVVARGKAQTRECAEHLACMHAELMLDALARPLFPQDSARQAKHAQAVRRFGRWAPDPTVNDVNHPRPHDALPLPLKQQIGGDEVWLDPQMLRRYSYTRSLGERLIAAHNEINNYCGDYIESLPDPQLLAETRKLLEMWQYEVARNPHPDLFVITRMGDQYRASTLLPVPRAFGVRGGNAVGKTIEQAMDLCALHAVDTLCALGIPLYADPTRQRAFLEERRRMGLVTFDDMMNVSSNKGLVAILAPSLSAEVESTSAKATEKKGCPPYLPGYIVEGSQIRPLPHISDTLYILNLQIPEDFDVYGEKLSDEAIIEAGNEAKVCVQNYLRQHLPRKSNVNVSVYITGYGRQVSVHNIAYLPLVLPKKGGQDGAADTMSAVKKKKKKKKANDSTPVDSSPVGEEAQKINSGDNTATTTTTTTTTASSCAAVEGGGGSKVLPNSHSQSDEKEGETIKKEPQRLLAVGISLKKKDAERMCYLHAVDILRSLGQDVLSNYRAGLPRRKQQMPVAQSSTGTTNEGGAAVNATATVNTTVNSACNKPSAAAQETEPETTRVLKPYMHKLMKQFITSGRHYTPPKRRFQPGPHSPF